MAWAEFEEKEYEVAASVELGSGGGFLMSPGQVLEEVVAYDVAAGPVANHVIWRLLSVERPAGVRLVPRLWFAGSRPAPGRLPTQPVSMILQYKRPEHLRGSRAAQWSFWKTPYFRFERREPQHRALRRLDRLLLEHAVVRYAAPAFWQVSELEAAIVTRSVLDRSGFVAPTALGSHRVWTFTEPGTTGRANPSGRSAHFEAIEELLRLGQTDSERLLPQRVDGIEALSEHLEVVAAAARNRAPRLRTQVDRWMASVRRRDLILSEEGLRRIGNLASITSLTSQIGAWWSIADRLDPPALATTETS